MSRNIFEIIVNKVNFNKNSENYKFLNPPFSPTDITFSFNVDNYPIVHISPRPGGEVGKGEEIQFNGTGKSVELREKSGNMNFFIFKKEVSDFVLISVNNSNNLNNFKNFNFINFQIDFDNNFGYADVYIRFYQKKIEKPSTAPRVRDRKQSETPVRVDLIEKVEPITQIPAPRGAGGGKSKFGSLRNRRNVLL